MPPNQAPLRVQEVVIEDTRSAAWLLGSKLSLAAVDLDAVSSPQDRARWFAEAEQLARRFQSELPPLPPISPENSASQAIIDRVQNYLIPTGKRLIEKLDQDYGREHAALFEAALRSNLLLLLYKPDSQTVNAICEPLPGVVQSAQLPQGLFQPLYSTLDRNAEWDEIRQQVMDMHVGVERYLAHTPAVGQSPEANQTR